MNICANLLPVLHGTRAPIRRRICVPGCSGQQKPSAWGKERWSNRNEAAEAKGKTPSGLCNGVWMCVFILCADFFPAHPSAIF